MSKTVLRNYGFHLTLAIMLLGSLSIITSCGGGGGGGGGGGITYDGLVTQASISAGNASSIFSAVWNGGATTGSASLSKASPAVTVKDSGTVVLFRQLRDRVLATGLASQSKTTMFATAVNETYNGSVSGTLTISGNIDANYGTGSLTMTYVNYNDGDGYTYAGTIGVKINGFDMTNILVTDGTMSSTLLTIKSADGDISLSGSMRLQESRQNNSDTLTVNMDGRDNSTGDLFRYQNFVVTSVYDNILFPSTETETDSGRVYVSRYGYADVTTTNPLIYASYFQEFPNSGGPVILSGAGGSKAVITPISAVNVRIDVDADGNGVYESTNTYAWSNLAGQPVAP